MNTTSLFDFMAIRLPGGTKAQYFYGDNLSGFYEGYTFSPEQGSGYLIRDRALFRDFQSRVGARPVRRELANEAVLYPHAVEHRYDDGRAERFSLLTGRRAVAMTLAQARPAVLSICPMLDARPDELTVSVGKGHVLIANQDRGEFIAFASATPMSFEGLQKHPRWSSLCLRADGPSTEFTVYAALGTDARSAIDLARSLVREDGLAKHAERITDVLTRSRLSTGHDDYDRALLWAKLSSWFMVVEEFGKGIWAGLPWFRDNWGRDTFIALPGTLLATGMFDEAKEVIRNFFRWQNKDASSKNYGRVPNRVASATDIIYNTTDGTPWLVREVYEYLCYTGDLEFVEEVYPSIKLALEGPIRHYVDGQGFLTHDDADTWMDARIAGNLPWSARGNRANDIQALWFTALQAGARLAKLSGDAGSAKAWSVLAAKMKRNFPKLFWNARKKVLADRVEADGRPDFKVRPNQLMVISVPLLDPLVTDDQARAITRNAVGELLYPYGIASLSQNDPYFHPYHHNDAWHHYDAAYHNGTVWGWNAGFTTTAMCRYGQTELAWKLARNLSAQILNDGCRGAMSELVVAMPDAEGRITLSGTWAQAWSTAEFVRNAYQDFAGFNPRLLDGVIELNPHIPAGWGTFSCSFPFGRGGRLVFSGKKAATRLTIVVKMEGHPEPLHVSLTMDAFGRQYRLRCRVYPDEACTLTIEKSKGAAVVEKNTRSCAPIRGTKVKADKPLPFVKPSLKAKPKSIREKDFLQKIIEAGAYK